MKVVFLLLIVLFCQSVFSDIPSSILETIVVTGRATENSRDSVAGSVGVVDKDTLKIIQHSHISESADRVAGVWVSRGNGQEHLTAIRSPVFTGPGSCGEFLVLENGVPTRPAGFCNVNQLFETNSEQAERIEVLKGPSSALYGSNAVHGVINVITPDVPVEKSSSVMIDAGPHDYRRVFASHTDGDSFVINAHADYDGGYKDDSGFEQQKINLKSLSNVNYNNRDIKTESFVELSNLRQETAGYIEGLDVYKDDSRKKYNPNPEAYRNASSVHGYTKFSQLNQEGEGWQLTPYINSSEMEFVMHWLPTNPLEKNNHWAMGLNGKFFYPLELANHKHLAVVSGFNLESSRVSIDEFQSNPAPVFALNLVQGQHYDFDVDLKSVGLFSEVEYELGAAIKLIAGLRYDYQYYDYDSHTLANTVGRYTRLADQTDEFSNSSINIGWLWDWKKQQQMFINTSTGYRAPQIAELYRLEGGVPASAVDSVQVESVEWGVRGSLHQLSWGEHLFYELSFFVMNKDNVILKNAFPDRQYSGTAETSHQGLELTLDYWLTQNMYVRGAVTYAEHRYKDVTDKFVPGNDIEGNIIDTAPRDIGSIQVGYDWGDVLIELELKHMGDYFLDPEHDWGYEGHDLFNLRARWQIEHDLTLSARLLNIANRDYAERADVKPFAGTPRYFVGEPRSLYLSLEKMF